MRRTSNTPRRNLRHPRLSIVIGRVLRFIRLRTSRPGWKADEHTEAYLTRLEMDIYWKAFAAGRTFSTPEQERAARAASDWQYATEDHMLG